MHLRGQMPVRPIEGVIHLVRRYCYIVPVLCCLTILLSAAAYAAVLRTPPGSFATKFVTSPAELSDLVKNDQVAARRFSEHFGVTRAELVAYFRDHLQVKTLSRSGDYTIYFISKGGRVASRRARLFPGEKVFAGPDGKPVILARCGNPLARRLPKIPVRTVREIPPPKLGTAEPLISLQESELVPTLVQAEAAPALTSEPPEPPIVLSTTVSTFTRAAWLAPALLGAVAVRSKHSEVIPEPMSLAALGLGISGLVLRCRFRRTRTR